MANTLKLEVTKAELLAIVEITDVISGMIGTGSDFDNNKKHIKKIDAMLKKNGYKRKYN